MIVTDLDIVGIAVLEPETDAPLIVDGYEILSGTIAAEKVQRLPGGSRKVSARGAASIDVSLCRRALEPPDIHILDQQVPSLSEEAGLLSALLAERAETL